MFLSQTFKIERRNLVAVDFLTRWAYTAPQKIVQCLKKVLSAYFEPQILQVLICSAVTFLAKVFL